jgi:hypothetical protein
MSGMRVTGLPAGRQGKELLSGKGSEVRDRERHQHGDLKSVTGVVI